MSKVNNLFVLIPSSAARVSVSAVAAWVMRCLFSSSSYFSYAPKYARRKALSVMTVTMVIIIIVVMLIVVVVLVMFVVIVPFLRLMPGE
jgi:hypothetical protein